MHATARKNGLDDRDLARVIHTLHWSVNFGLGDHAPAPPFDTLTPDQQKPLLRLVEHIKAGGGPAEAQDMWIAHMASLGFEPGRIKDPGAVPPTHPDMVPWDEMSEWGRAKLEGAFDVVRRFGNVA